MAASDMAGFGRVASACLGAAALELLSVLLASLPQAPLSSAAWGWTMGAPEGISCEEGKDEYGCEAMPPDCGERGGCCPSNYICTTADGGCHVLRCSKNGGRWSQPNKIACINIETPGKPVDSELAWQEAEPSVCAKAAAASAGKGGASKKKKKGKKQKKDRDL